MKINCNQNCFNKIREKLEFGVALQSFYSSFVASNKSILSFILQDMILMHQTIVQESLDTSVYFMSKL